MKSYWERSVQDQYQPTVDMITAAFGKRIADLSAINAAVVAVGRVFPSCARVLDQKFEEFLLSEPQPDAILPDLNEVNWNLEGMPQPLRPKEAVVFMPLVIQRDLLEGNLWLYSDSRFSSSRGSNPHTVQALTNSVYLLACLRAHVAQSNRVRSSGSNVRSTLSDEDVRAARAEMAQVLSDLMRGDYISNIRARERQLVRLNNQGPDSENKRLIKYALAGGALGVGLAAVALATAK